VSNRRKPCVHMLALLALMLSMSSPHSAAAPLEAAPSQMTPLEELESIKAKLLDLYLWGGLGAPELPVLVFSQYTGEEYRVQLTPELVRRGQACLVDCFGSKSLTQTVPEYSMVSLSTGEETCKRNYELALEYRKLAEDLLKVVESLQAKQPKKGRGGNEKNE
jgi:hypothetical protein